MPFVRKAREFLEKGLYGDHPKPKIVHDTLQFLLDNAVGSKKAIATWRILEHLQEQGHDVSNKPWWQVNILGYLRDQGIFIGWKNGRGLYIIATRKDAVEARDQYLARIAKEQQRLDILENLMEEAERTGWS